MNEILGKIGWGQAVDGFIPPAASEFQATGARSRHMRQLHHIEYTPAPDTARGGRTHQLLVDREYSDYLHVCEWVPGRCRRRRISELYEAIRTFHPQGIAGFRSKEVEEATRRWKKASRTRQPLEMALLAALVDG
jgi:hypothetical protein